jgi:hypothetical protein
MPAAAIDFANVASATAGAGTSVSVNVTCAVTDNFLLVAVGGDIATLNAPPTGITYNGAALTLIGSQNYTSNYRGNVSRRYLNNPTTGSALPLVTTEGTNITGFAMAAIPMSGVNTSTPPALGTTGSFASSAAASCVTSGAGPNDIQFGSCFIRSSGLASGGAPQANVITPINGINGIDGFACDYIPGVSAGNFSWTLTSGNWIGLGVTVFGQAALSVATGFYSLAGQAALFVSAASGNLVLLAAPGLYNTTFAPPQVTAPVLSVATGIYSIAGQAAAFLAVSAPGIITYPIGLDVYDGLNGTLNLAWGQLLNPPADSYNIYLDGVLNQNVVGLLATVTGLTKESYNPATGVITQSGTYHLKVVAVRGGVEIVAVHKTVTVNPSSVALVTPMKRIFPFPNSGLN